VTLEQALAEYNRTHGAGFESRGSLPGGEVGASEVVDADGQRWVAKWEWPAADGVLAGVRAALRIVAALRGRGARLPEYLVAEPVAEGMLVVQRMMPGFTSDEIPVSLRTLPIRPSGRSTGQSDTEHQMSSRTGWRDHGSCSNAGTCGPSKRPGCRSEPTGLLRFLRRISGTPKPGSGETKHFLGANHAVIRVGRRSRRQPVS
jgi:hypothetical protein